MPPIVTRRRERLRVATRAEIAARGMDQVARGGPAALSLVGIAREMGMSGPAIYRYFDGRDALLARLVKDVFVGVADEMGRAAASAGAPDGRLPAVGHAYRSWALAHPREYILLTARVPPTEGREDMLAATQRALDLLIDGLRQLRPGDAASADDPPWLARFAVVAWQRMHGHLALELEGLHPVMGVEPGPLYAEELEGIAAEARRRWAAPSAPVSRGGSAQRDGRGGDRPPHGAARPDRATSSRTRRSARG